MATLISAPKLVSFTPVFYSAGGQLYISLPIGNAGTAAAPSVYVTGITLGPAPRVSPAGLPVFLGDLAIGNQAALNTRFSAAGLGIGQQYLLTIRGTYGTRPAQYGYTINRYLTIPDPIPVPVPLLQATVRANLDTAVWNYTVVNNESAGSTLSIAAFSLDVANAVTVTGTPPGWAVTTDNMTSVLWYSLDAEPPYASHVQPGASLGGFQIQCATALSESTAYAVTSWDHASNAAGLVSFDYLLSPGRPA